MRLDVAFFAAFREQAGLSQVSVETSCIDARSLFEQMREQYAGLERYENMKFAVNDEMVAADYALQEGDRVLFFPPVAGG